MSLSDCSHCWNHICTCGWDYRNYSIKKLEAKVRMFQAIIDFRKNNSDVKFSGFFGPETEDDKVFFKYMNDKAVMGEF
jgi:hypothetical protein